MSARPSKAVKLHSFFRSGTSHRLRIALNLKGLAYDYIAVDLRREAHLAPAFRALNPQGLVPALEVYLVPQVESARRFGIELARWPLILAIDTACAQIDAFRLASPALQPDAG